jgi:hypothetical protein
MTDRTARGSSEAKTTRADSMATSVPAPIAMPTSGRANAGASFTPSPTIRPMMMSAVLALISLRLDGVGLSEDGVNEIVVAAEPWLQGVQDRRDG